MATKTTPAGQDPQSYIAALMNRIKITTQLGVMPTEAIREHLAESGALTAGEQDNSRDNLDWLLWLACNDLAEEFRNQESEQ